MDKCYNKNQWVHRSSIFFDLRLLTSAAAVPSWGLSLFVKRITLLDPSFSSL